MWLTTKQTLVPFNPSANHFNARRVRVTRLLLLLLCIPPPVDACGLFFRHMRYCLDVGKVEHLPFSAVRSLDPHIRFVVCHPITPP